MGEVKKSYSKLIILLAVLVVVLAGVYVLLFTPSLANDLRIIKIRNGYVNILEKVVDCLNLSEFDNFVYLRSPIRVLSKQVGGDEYYYSLRGRMEKIEAERGVVYLRCSDGKLYGFRVQMKPDYAHEWVRLVGVEYKVDKMVKTNFVFNATDMSRSGEKDTLYDSKQIYSVIWQDKRLLSEILAAYKQNPLEAINATVEQVRYISR